MNKTHFTYSISAAAALLAIVLFFCTNRTNVQIREQKERLIAYEQLLSRKDKIEAESEPQKAGQPLKDRPDEALNIWLKNLLEYAQKERVTFEKIEPQGILEKKGGKNMRIFLLFAGSGEALGRFLHSLYEKDAFSRIVSLGMRADEERKNFIFEISLEKSLL